MTPPTSSRANCGQLNRKRRQRHLLRRHVCRPPADRGVTVSLKARQFLLGTAAFGWRQLGNASRPSTTLLRPPSPRISLRSSNSSKRRNRKTARFRSDTCEPKNREAYHGPCTRASVQFYSDIPSTYRRPGSRLWKPEIDGQRLCRRAFLRDEEAHPKRRGALQDAR